MNMERKVTIPKCGRYECTNEIQYSKKSRSLSQNYMKINAPIFNISKKNLELEFTKKRTELTINIKKSSWLM